MLATICGAAFEITFWLTKRRFSLVGGWSWRSCLPRSRPQHASIVWLARNKCFKYCAPTYVTSCAALYAAAIRPQTLAIQIHIWSFVRWYSTPHRQVKDWVQKWCKSHLVMCHLHILGLSYWSRPHSKWRSNRLLHLQSNLHQHVLTTKDCKHA